MPKKQSKAKQPQSKQPSTSPVGLPLDEISLFTPPQPTTNELASGKILAVYPQHKQLNILMQGTQKEKDIMVAYIGKIRSWANTGAKPNPKLLDNIKP